MCGIVGYLNILKEKKSLDEKLKLIKHRGPDNASETFYNLNSCSVGFGHTRLSIIDLQTRANQPFESICKNYAIVFNGEIYNYAELSNEHLKNVQLKTSSDTEVILALYIMYGSSFVSLLKGMFSFVILDKRKEQLVCSRDPLGIKPFYYFLNEQNFMFCSEIKPIFKFNEIKKEFDLSILPEYLLNGFLYEPSTGYSNIKKLLPGHIVTIKNQNGKIVYEQKEYWKPLAGKHSSLSELLQTSVKEHLASDVPVGLFFSGGVDSTLILTEVKSPIKLYMLRSKLEDISNSGFVDDHFYAKRIAGHLGVQIYELEIEESHGGLLKEIDHIAKSIEEPIADYTFIASQRISKAARENGYKVMLSGMGADEIFAGYPRYALVANSFMYGLLKPFSRILKHHKSYSKKIERFNSFYREDEFIMKYTSLVGYFSTFEIAQAFGSDSLYSYKDKLNSFLEGYEDVSDLKKAMLLDLKGFLSHNFTVADKSSMLESIEVRVPLATPELFNYSMGLKDSQLIKSSNTKYVLKKHLEKKIPKKLIYRKKAGFNPPLDNSIIKLGKTKIMEYCLSNGLNEIVAPLFLRNILDAHFSKKVNNTYKIYCLMFLSAWYKNSYES